MSSPKKRSLASAENGPTRKKLKTSERTTNARSPALKSADKSKSSTSSLTTIKARVELLAREVLYFSQRKAKAVAVEYLRFMQLKAKFDKSTSDLAPSSTVDDVWIAHLSDTRSYEALESLLLKKGGSIHHNPVWKEQPHFDRRLKNTKKLYEETFVSPPPPKIWDGSDDESDLSSDSSDSSSSDSSDSSSSESSDSSSSDSDSSSESSNSSSDSDVDSVDTAEGANRAFFFSVKVPDGRTVTVRARGSSSLWDLKRELRAGIYGRQTKNFT